MTDFVLAGSGEWSEDEWEEVDGVFSSSGESWTDLCHDDCEEPPSHVVEANGGARVVSREDEVVASMKSLTVDTMPADEVQFSQEDEMVASMQSLTVDAMPAVEVQSSAQTVLSGALSDSSEEEGPLVPKAVSNSGAGRNHNTSPISSLSRRRASPLQGRMQELLRLRQAYGSGQSSGADAPTKKPAVKKLGRRKERRRNNDNFTNNPKFWKAFSGENSSDQVYKVMDTYGFDEKPPSAFTELRKHPGGLEYFLKCKDGRRTRVSST